MCVCVCVCVCWSGWGGWKGALVTGQSKDAHLNTSDDSSPGPQSGPEEGFFKKNYPHDTCLKMISASWGSFLAACVGVPQDCPPLPPNLPRQPVRGHRHGSPEREGGVQ